jgi:hypothetical protein
MRVQSNSSLKVYQDCPAKYRRKYLIGGVAEQESEAARIGSEFHKAVEYWPDQQAILHSAATPITRGMLRRWLEDRRRQTVEVIANEVPWECTIGGIEVRGYIDCVARVDGATVLIERKTTGMNLDQYVSMKSTDRQPLLYLIAARQAGFDIDYVAFDVTYRPRIKQGTRESGHDFEMRVYETSETRWSPIYATDLDLKLVEEDVDGLAKLITYSETNEVWPRNRDACSKYGSTCEFLSDCMNGV